MRLTVIGSGTSQPQPETPASGLLIETESTAILVDCGQGIIRELMGIHDPRELDAIVIGHMHADHYIDLVSLRYLTKQDLYYLVMNRGSGEDLDPGAEGAVDHR